LEGLSDLFTDDEQDKQALASEHQRQWDELNRKIGRLATQLAWLKRNLAPTLVRAARLAQMKRGHPHLSLKTKCDLLLLNQTRLNDQPGPPCCARQPTDSAGDRPRRVPDRDGLRRTNWIGQRERK
jgi:hypothetical protein